MIDSFPFVDKLNFLFIRPFICFSMNTSIVNNVGIEEPLEEEWTYDPNEPRYCICNQVSYGDMVACDNQDVSKNFHIGANRAPNE